MTRRIVRTIIQVASAAVFTFLVIFFLDRNFRVLPNSIHEHMPQHHAGLIITDITIAKCSSLNVFSSCKLDTDVWYRIEKDLYLGKSMVSGAYLHVQRKKEEELTADDKVVMDVQVGRLDPGVGTKGEADERWESRPGGLWIKRSAKRHASDSKEAVTAVDVLFGDDAVEAREGWDMPATGTALLIDSGPKIPSAHITLRRGSQKEPTKPQPRINDNGKFKIMQVADLHLSTGVGHCRDAVPDGYNGGQCEADPRTLDFVTKILEEERPDLIVLSGDQVNGDTAPDAQSAIFKYAQLFIKYKVPYVSIFGNHDDEGKTSLPRSGQMALIETLPYSLSVAGPDDIDGVGNYVLEILARGKSSHSALTIYLLDSHSYSPDERKFKGYDWIKKNQIDWFQQTAEGLKKKHREYTHYHMDVAFIHIPLPEYRDKDQYFKGEWKEHVTAPNFNSGFHDALVEQGVVMVSCGHDHVNEYCALSVDDKKKPNLWMCYGGGAGFGGYAGYGGFHRKIRIFDFDMNEARVSTWKRTEYGETDKKLDEQIIVDAGKPVAPMEG
ncbi:putative phosphatase dcr2 protein [Phaeoacremonium minimum UCRPA7]|uniref:Putative phosphatase dcr2 protein n=1 Tax=Phaeoacremonium minimum (strain UCR-PA7) TaxID=1286976 RepID=R8BUK0_PHAM7|nr:putative phosphatase dcr2 protein [Phaeoacremonium minimum UCRPA7]EOO02964.1 putative phosphatase dcr2 protein [Phaeoacremonium minimum UCRPA7]